MIKYTHTNDGWVNHSWKAHKARKCQSKQPFLQIATKAKWLVNGHGNGHLTAINSTLAHKHFLLAFYSFTSVTAISVLPFRFFLCLFFESSLSVYHMTKSPYFFLIKSSLHPFCFLLSYTLLVSVPLPLFFQFPLIHPYTYRSFLHNFILANHFRFINFSNPPSRFYFSFLHLGSTYQTIYF